MNLTARVMLASEDPAFVRRLQAFCAGAGDPEPRVAGTLQELELTAQGVDGLLLLLDLQTPDYARVVEFAVSRQSSCLAIAFALPDSEPERLALASGLYAVLNPGCERSEFQMLMGRAAAHLRLMQECALLKAAAAPAALPAAAPAPPPGAAALDARAWRTFALSLRDFDRVDALCQQIVEGVSGIARVSRIGLFHRAHDDEAFTLQAGVRCLERSRVLSYPGNHPLVQWLHGHAHLISRLTLDHIPTIEDRLMLRQAMDLLGAEVIIPIHLRQQFAGWMLFGHHVTGRPFTQGELEELMSITEHVSVVIENARLYEEVSLRKGLAETLFDSLPTGIIATTASGSVLWINRSAAEILHVDADRHLNRPVDTLGSRFADCIYRALEGRELRVPEVWRLPPSNRTLAVQTRRLSGNPERLGAVALIEDITDQRLMIEREEQLARCAFWAELAASMSHEVRNPLVAIKTFAQLLPERHEDEEFRTQFSEVVSHEVDRLDSIVKQMNQFANLPRPELLPLDIREPIQRGQDIAKLRVPTVSCAIDVSAPPRLPTILGDSRVLADCFAHLFANAMEAMGSQAHPAIQVRLAVIPPEAERPPRLHVAIIDNGGGIPKESLPRVYSPFYTTKNRGMGLGLAIVQRMVLDHNGQIDMLSNTSGPGMTVNILLPVAEAEPDA